MRGYGWRGCAIAERFRGDSAPRFTTDKEDTMKIKTKRQFRDGIDSAFETMKTRDEAKACYDFSREEYNAAEEESCAHTPRRTPTCSRGATARAAGGRPIRSSTR